MTRRKFLASSALASASTFVTAPWIARGAPYDDEFAEVKKRVGVIGTGWYGKCDLFRLLQVAPVEVVALCDVDSQMLADAADQTAARQVSKKRPRVHGDYREMLKEKDLDIVLVATPDHWHALATIAALEAGADVYVQKPISVDVMEGHAMRAAARRLGRVVQVGTQRRSTPHLIEAKNDIIGAGKLGRVGLVEICCYYHMRNRSNPPDEAPPASLDYELWTGPAPLRPYNRLVHPRSWRAFMEYGNGIVGDMCIHMLDMVRWLLDLGAPDRIFSTGGIYVEKDAKANITDTQTATFQFGDLPVVWTHRTYGAAPDPQYPWAATLYGDKGMLKAGVMGYDFTPQGNAGTAVHREVAYEFEEFPEDRTEKDLETHVAPAIRGHMKDFLRQIAQRGRPVADIEQGYLSSAACILANVSQQLGGRSLGWDPATGRTGDAEADRLLARPYRSPWVHPAAG